MPPKTPLPTLSLTPYDISGPDYISYSPGLLEWAILFFLVMALCIFLARRILVKKKAPIQRLHEQLDRIIALLDNNSNPVAANSEVSIIIKRFLESLFNDTPFTSLSVKELQDWGKAQEPIEFKKISSFLCELDQARYQGKALDTQQVVSQARSFAVETWTHYQALDKGTHTP